MSTVEDFLQGLQRATRKHPESDAFVFWAKGTDWSDASDEPLDAEELPYYAEGLLMEGFGLCWRLLMAANGEPVMHLYCWQADPPELPSIQPELTLSATGQVSVR